MVPTAVLLGTPSVVFSIPLVVVAAVVDFRTLSVLVVDVLVVVSGGAVEVSVGPATVELELEVSPLPPSSPGVVLKPHFVPAVVRVAP